MIEQELKRLKIERDMWRREALQRGSVTPDERYFTCCVCARIQRSYGPLKTLDQKPICGECLDEKLYGEARRRCEARGYHETAVSTTDGISTDIRCDCNREIRWEGKYNEVPVCWRLVDNRCVPVEPTKPDPIQEPKGSWWGYQTLRNIGACSMLIDKDNVCILLIGHEPPCGEKKE